MGIRRKKRVLVTAGPTRAYLDSVRFLSNLSTGRLGFEICRQLKKQGHDVYVVTGPSACEFEGLHLRKVVRVETNFEMRDAVMGLCRRVRPDYGVFSAAVLDFVPRVVKKKKTSSKKKNWSVSLVPAPKIIQEVRKRFPEVKQITFKLENRMSSKKAAALARKRLETAEAVIVNYIEEVQGREHPALLFNADKVQRLKTKPAIATAISKIINL